MNKTRPVGVVAKQKLTIKIDLLSDKNINSIIFVIFEIFNENFENVNHRTRQTNLF